MRRQVHHSPRGGRARLQQIVGGDVRTWHTVIRIADSNERTDLVAGSTASNLPYLIVYVQGSGWRANAYQVDDPIHCDHKANTRPVGRQNLQTRVLHPLGAIRGIPDLRAGNPVLTEGGICNNEFKVPSRTSSQ